MGIDLGGGNGTLPPEFRSRMETTERSWPKCYPCSEKLGALYPVESFGIVSHERPTALNMRHRIVVEVECHGLTQRMVIDSLRWHGTANDFDAIGDTFAFVRSGTGLYKVEKVPANWREMHKPIKLWK